MIQLGVSGCQGDGAIESERGGGPLPPNLAAQKPHGLVRTAKGKGCTRAPRLMLVIDVQRSRLPLLDLVAEGVAGGVDAIYVRGAAGDAGIAPTPEVILELRGRVGGEVALLVNNRPGAEPVPGTGLHLRERDELPVDARGLNAPKTLIGRSVHSPGKAAASVGMDYLLAGHVYPSVSKPGRLPLRIEGFSAIVAAAPCPVLAIGGITAERVAEVVQAGAYGVAVIGAIVESSDPRAAAAALRGALDLALQHGNEVPRMDEAISAVHAMETIEIVVNGKPAILPAATTVHDFLAMKRMTDAMAIVERNGIIVPRAEYGMTSLHNGDHLEVVHAVGGG